MQLVADMIDGIGDGDLNNRNFAKTKNDTHTPRNSQKIFIKIKFVFQRSS